MDLPMVKDTLRSMTEGHQNTDSMVHSM